MTHSLRSHCCFSFLIALLAWIAAPAFAAATPEHERPNVVIILADDLGIHDLGVYGRKDHPTPNLDRLASEGLRFTSAYCAQPICSASRAALLTGRTPARLHLTTYLPGRPDAPSQRLLHPAIQPQLPLTERTLAESFRQAGYATACLGKWHLGGPGFGPESQGFETVHAGKANTVPSDSEGAKGEMDLARAASAFIRDHRATPFFVLLAHNSPHIPYAERPGAREKFAGAFEPGYASMIADLDRSVGAVLETLRDTGLEKSTLVLFTSDNGGLHVPELRHARVTHNGPFRAGKGYLYEGGLRIPLLARWPGHFAARTVLDTPIVNTDLAPTLLELCGLPVPDGLDGLSVARGFNGTDRLPKRRLYWHFPHYTNQGGRPAGAVRDGRWKLVLHDDTQSLELFDLDADPGERRDLATQFPRRARRLARALDAWRTRVNAQRALPNPKVDETAFRALYLDFDPSRFEPATASAADWARVAAWRVGMDEAVTRRP